MKRITDDQRPSGAKLGDVPRHFALSPQGEGKRCLPIGERVGLKVLAPGRSVLLTALRTLCAAILLSFSALASAADRPAAPPAIPFEVYFLIGEIPVWMGDKIGYTVYEPAVVEARFLSASGEIMLIYREGERAPGQYMLPWDGTVDGSPFAGFYSFELYFGDEYAAKHQMIVNPLFPKP